MTNVKNSPLAAGVYLVATPIGNARDVTLRTLDILGAADILAAEDTRSLRRLLDIHAIPLGGRPLLAYHEHNGARVRPQLLEAAEAGGAVAYASEAGTPLISDPGYDLVRAARDAGLPVTTAPGACAAIAALTVAGLPTDRFHFVGFLPNAAGARRRVLEEVKTVDATLVFYESPRRVQSTLADAVAVLGADRPAALCRELTKIFEETREGTLAELLEKAGDDPPRGEIVLLVGRGTRQADVSETEIESMLEQCLNDMSVRDAADVVAGRFGIRKRMVYQMAMRIAGRDGGRR